MFGARARAAEYHAAKAASARQQANQDEDEQRIPKPMPISLSAFTRNAFPNRNKGTKTFKPLILAEEEERRSSDSVDLGSESHGSLSPRADIVDLPRASSVPVPQTLTGFHYAQAERSVQTPYRYREPHVPSIATRTMFPEDGYGFPSHLLPVPPLYLQATYHTHSAMQQSMIPTPAVGWYISPDYYPSQQSHHDTVMPPATPVPETCPSTRPQLQHFGTVEPNHQIELQQKSSSENSSADLSQTSPRVEGQRLYVFGPDDVSPTKIEVKQQAREKYFAEHGDLLPTPNTGMAERSVNTPEPLELIDMDELMRYLQISGQTRPSSQTTPSGTLKDLLINRNSIAPVTRRAEEVSTLSWNLQAVAKPGELALQGKNEADWPYLGQAQGYQTQIAHVDAASTKEVAGSRKHDVTTDIKQMLDSMRAKPRSPVTVRPPPGLERSPAESSKFQELESEQITSIKFPLVDMNSHEWLDIRMPTAAERDQMRRVRHVIRTSSLSEKHKNTEDVRQGMVRDDLKNWIQIKVRDVDGRRGRVHELAEEMQRKWEHGDSFQSATMSKADAEKHAGTVKAVGGIMSALSMQLEDMTDSSQRGTRPYCQAPEYAIERNIGVGKSRSLFGSEDDSSTAPPRLARDPRFRPQLANGMKHAADKGRIPRMFAARRVM